MADDDLIVVGRVARTHGNRGQVIVNPETDFPDERFRPGVVLLVLPGGGGTPVARRITAARFHQGRPVIALEGIDSMSDAEALAGAELLLASSELGELPAGTFRHYELIGCEVRDTSQALLGRVTAVEGPMERSRLIVEGARGEIQVPLIEGICVSIDPAAGRIVVDPPEGLIELNETRG
jgi:16S rRNA processing protein RimM